MNEHWYAVYTKPRWEKKVAATLSALKVPHYCPLNRVIRQWSDRKKTVYEPLFTSYVFVRVTEKQFGALRKIDGVLNLVHWLGKPALIRDEEITTIKDFLALHPHVQVERTQVQVENTVKVNEGPLQDKEGTVVAVKRKTLTVALRALGFTLYAEIPKASVAVQQAVAAT